MRGRARFEIRQTGDGERVVDAAGGPLPAEVAELVAGLRQARTDERAAVDRQRVIVQELLAAGASWTVVGWCLGMSRAQAQRRHGGDRLV